MKRISPVIVEAHQFAPKDLIGGDVALDFVNTVTGRDQSPRDWLDSYRRLLDWSELVELLPRRYLRKLAQLGLNTRAATAALARAKNLREALFSIVDAIKRNDKAATSDLALLRDHWIAGTSAHELNWEAGHVVVTLRSDAVDLDLVASMIAYRMVQRVLHEPTDRLRICAGPNCSWLFLDQSKAGRRRWCDMAVCGNAAKSKRFYERLQSDGKAAK